jgi:hypothetical protein
LSGRWKEATAGGGDGAWIHLLSVENGIWPLEIYQKFLELLIFFTLPGFGGGENNGSPFHPGYGYCIMAGATAGHLGVARASLDAIVSSKEGRQG